MQVTHGGFHCEVGTKRSGNAVKQNRLLEDESLQEDGIFFKRRQTIMSEKPKYYITTAIAYASGKPHIGNTYEIVLADAIARYKRSQGYDVFFQTGTDEHGQKIELKAEEAGITPKEFVDKVSGEIKRIWDLMDTSYDKFIRTTDEDHEKQVKKIFKKLYDKGDIYKGHYEGMYCTPCESFFTESQLVDGKCPDCGRPVQPAKEEAYFFKMSKYADRLIEHINTHPEFIQPVSRKNEMMNNFLLPGLQDLCVSRTSFKWGIPVDFDPKHVVYVWLDALTNYITGIGYDAEGNSTEQFNKLWPADLHLIGKDIIRFHTIYWPIFLMALDLPLPKQVFGHPWLLQGDGKMSKSKGNVLYADELVDFFGVDAVRYFVLHEMPFENDGVISWELMVERLNSDLANTLGKNREQDCTNNLRNESNQACNAHHFQTANIVRKVVIVEATLQDHTQQEAQVGKLNAEQRLVCEDILERQLQAEFLSVIRYDMLTNHLEAAKVHNGCKYCDDCGNRKVGSPLKFAQHGKTNRHRNTDDTGNCIGECCRCANNAIAFFWIARHRSGQRPEGNVNSSECNAASQNVQNSGKDTEADSSEKAGFQET